jgi:hypothetical protein
MYLQLHIFYDKCINIKLAKCFYLYSFTFFGLESLRLKGNPLSQRIQVQSQPDILKTYIKNKL